MSRFIVRKLIPCLLLLCGISAAAGQDHNHQDHQAVEIDESVESIETIQSIESQQVEHDHEQMTNSTMAEMPLPQTDGLRDPHAYSNGYERTSGPYALPAQRQVRLADEAVFAGVWMDRFEYVKHDEDEGAELEGFAWFGNSYRQILLQTQIETIEGKVEEGEVDLLLSQAISPFWDLRVGVHRSFGESTDRDWGAIGVKGLAPYWFEVEANLHIGDGGHAAFDFEADYELLISQRLVLQPRLDISAFSETDSASGHGSGLSTIKIGARLRYEFDRQFAPYIGVEHVKRFGETADLLPMGVDRSETHVVAGIRFWF